MVTSCLMCVSFLSSTSSVVELVLSARAVTVLRTQSGKTELVGACAQGHMSPEPPGSATHGRGRCDTDRVGEHSQVEVCEQGRPERHRTAACRAAAGPWARARGQGEGRDEVLEGLQVTRPPDGG